MEKNPLNILIIRLSSMGDVILTSPLVRQIKTKYPNSNLFYIVARQFAEALEYNPYIDHLVKYDKQSDLNQIVSLKNHLKNQIPLRVIQYQHKGPDSLYLPQ